MASMDIARKLTRMNDALVADDICNCCNPVVDLRCFCILHFCTLHHTASHMSLRLAVLITSQSFKLLGEISSVKSEQQRRCCTNRIGESEHRLSSKSIRMICFTFHWLLPHNPLQQFNTSAESGFFCCPTATAKLRRS